MGPKGAVEILFRKEIADAEDPNAALDQRVAEYAEKFANPYVAASRGFVEDITEGTAVEILHNQVCDLVFTGCRETKVSDVNHVRVTKTPRGPRLAFEAGDEFLVAHKLRRDQFKRDVALRAQVCSQVDSAHASATKLPLESVLVVQHLTEVMIQSRRL